MMQVFVVSFALVAAVPKPIDFKSPASIAIISLAITTAGLLFAVVAQFMSSRRMNTLVQGISTRDIGEFPAHIAVITAVVAAARDEVLIMADCVDYASLSDPDGFAELKTQIERQKEKVKILLLGKPAPVTRSSPLHGADWNSMRSSKTVKEFFARYPGAVATSESEFHDVLKRFQEEVRSAFVRSGATILDLDDDYRDRIGPFLWIADRRVAVFLFLTEDSTARLAFRTEDAKLIAALRSIFMLNWEVAKNHRVHEK